MPIKEKRDMLNFSIIFSKLPKKIGEYSINTLYSLETGLVVYSSESNNRIIYLNKLLEIINKKQDKHNQKINFIDMFIQNSQVFK